MSREFLASEAKRLSDEPLLKQALTSMETATVNELLACPDDRRAELIITLRVIRGFQSSLRAMIADGSQPKRGCVA
jgi:hypothetical protein